MNVSENRRAHTGTHIDCSDCDLGGPIKLKPRVLYSLPKFCAVLWALLIHFQNI